MTEWQDISTAPKDGTWLLLFCPGGLEDRDWGVKNAPNITVGNWDAFDYQSASWHSVETVTEFWDYGGQTGAGTTTYRHAIDPTHWMQMPSTPGEQP